MPSQGDSSHPQEEKVDLDGNVSRPTHEKSEASVENAIEIADDSVVSTPVLGVTTTAEPNGGSDGSQRGTEKRERGIFVPWPIVVFLAFLLGAGISAAVTIPLVRSKNSGGASSEQTSEAANRSPTQSPGFKEEDPFNGSTTEVNVWPNEGLGLRLDVINALDDSWQDLYDTVIADWQSGTPNALSLNSIQVNPDYDCSAQIDVLKICNGNYGETSWRGINTVLVFNEKMIGASTVRMNDFYISTAESLRYRRYTLCHEMGHGFGLPHTDEDWFNADTGNCLDYTLNPIVNQQPGQRNFALLSELYGVLATEPNTTVGDDLSSSNNTTTTSFSERVRSLRMRKTDLHTSSPAAVIRALEHMDRIVGDYAKGIAAWNDPQLLVRDSAMGQIRKIHLDAQFSVIVKTLSA